MGATYILAGGGAGDFIYHYFKSYEWSITPTTTALYKQSHIIGVIACHSPTVAELIYTNPHIAAVHVYPWYPPGHEREHGWKYGLNAINIKDWGKAHKIRPAADHGLEHKIHLTPSEEQLIAAIQQHKYVAVHPFAGLPHRGCLRHPHDGQYKCYPDYKYVESINHLAEAGYHVVILGRTTLDGVDALRQTNEVLTDFSFHPNVLNLANKVSFRVNVELARRAQGFMGSHSSMLSAAWTADVPSLFFYPGYDEHGNKRSVIEHGGTTGTWALNKPYNTYYELSAADYLSLDSREPVQKLLGVMNGV